MEALTITTAATAAALLIALAALGLAAWAALRPQLERARLRRLEIELVDLDQDVQRLAELARAPQRREIMSKAREAKAEKLSKEDQLVADAAAALSARTQQTGEVASVPLKDRLRVAAGMVKP